MVGSWFVTHRHQPINLDEIAWVHDAVVYDWRVTKQFDQFAWSTTFSPSWSAHDFRLFDQPHFAKYIYGFFLSEKQLSPWTDTDQEATNFRLFTSQQNNGQLTLDNPLAVKTYGEATVAAIGVARVVSVSFALGFFLLLFWFLQRTASLLTATLTLSLLATNSVFATNFQLATANSISMFCMLLSFVCLYLLYMQSRSSPRVSFIFFFCSAVTAAFAAGTKIDGWLLVVLATGLILSTNIRQLPPIHITMQVGTWLLLFLGTYIYLQPELWGSIPSGLLRFFYHRLHQQQEFVEVYSTLSFAQYHVWLVSLLTQSSTKIIVVLKQLLLMFAGIGLLRSVVTKLPGQPSARISPATLVKLFVFSWIFFYWYARIGFDRYALWPLVLLATITSQLVRFAAAQKITHN